MRDTPNKNHPEKDVEFIIQELLDFFNNAENGQLELTSKVGSIFNARVVNAAKYLKLI